MNIRAVAAATMAVMVGALAFGILSLTSDWAHDQEGSGTQYRAMEIRRPTAGPVPYEENYSDGSFNGRPGIGQVRTASVFLVLGTILLGVGALAAEHGILLQRRWLLTTTAAVSSLAVVVFAIGLVLLPLGISDLSNANTRGGPPDLSWKSGLYSACVATVLGLAGTVAAWVVNRHSNLELEPASGMVDFED